MYTMYIHLSYIQLLLLVILLLFCQNIVMDTFKEQGLAIVIVAIFTFAGTFLGSTIIAQIILKMTGVI